MLQAEELVFVETLNIYGLEFVQQNLKVILFIVFLWTDIQPYCWLIIIWITLSVQIIFVPAVSENFRKIYFDSAQSFLPNSYMNSVH
jgi:hypothetical protein